jgi:hypothetical protein
VLAKVRGRVGRDFAIGVRFNAEEFIKDGYGIEDSKLIARRLAELGADYLSLSVGGKFEDAEHVPGQVLFPYSGYSGDRCMPGDWFPRALHVGLADEIRRYLHAHGHKIPVAVAGKLSDPMDAERALQAGSCDIVGIARGLLADPDWPRKVRNGELDRITQCDYCNVCKQLDGTHKPVICALWPQGSLQAPVDDRNLPAPSWDAQGAELAATVKGDTVALRWRKAAGAAHYDVYRIDETDQNNVRMLDGVKLTNWVDRGVLAGWNYHYFVRPCSATGAAGPASNKVAAAIA